MAVMAAPAADGGRQINVASAAHAQVIRRNALPSACLKRLRSVAYVQLKRQDIQNTCVWARAVKELTRI